MNTSFETTVRGVSGAEAQQRYCERASTSATIARCALSGCLSSNYPQPTLNCLITNKLQQEFVKVCFLLSAFCFFSYTERHREDTELHRES